MQNKYLINFSKKFWFWFWTKLMNGFAPSDLHGNYKRPKGIKVDVNYDINKQNKKIYLLVGKSCPWCHRTLLVYQIKNLSKQIKVIFLKADFEHGEWTFNEKFKGCKRLSDFYKRAHKNKFFRATLPLLVCSENNKSNILSNESNQIVDLLNSIAKESINESFDIKKCDGNLLDLIHYDINDGVYKCGFARNQVSYNKASKNLFSALIEIEKNLDQNKENWICGKELTYADIFLFPTLVRWELIYSKLFKCTAIELTSFRKIIEWRLRFFEFSNVHKTCSEEDWKKDYYKALFPLNPNQIIPVLPSLKDLIKLRN